MKKSRLMLSLLLVFALVVSSFSFASADTVTSGSTASYGEMKDLVKVFDKYLDEEAMFDYLSYVYLGWRTTGGTWQNQVIGKFFYKQLTKAGYEGAGEASTPLGSKSSNDKSSLKDKDYVWITNYDVDTMTWNPKYAKLEVVSAPDVANKDKLINKINVESYGFNPTSKIYQDHYGVKSVDEMWKWIIQKDTKGNRVNVLNGKEAELNKRCHLARETCFTDDGSATPETAKGVTGEAVYVGEISGENGNMTSSKFSTPEALATLKGKVLLSDSSLRDTFFFAKQVGAVAVMSTNSLSSYSVPKDSEGNIIPPYENAARYASGAGLKNTSTQETPIVEWQFSPSQKEALLELLEKSGDKPVTIKSVAIGDTYKMNDASKGGKGQAVAMAEIKGATKPDERIIICAHVQEPGANDNATGCGAMLEMAIRLKDMVDKGIIERPERTVTFLWGDEMNLATYWLDSHPDEKTKVVAALDMDMVGEDPSKTGGVMRIEKTPDPSAVYDYTLDILPWETSSYYDSTYAGPEGQFVRLPDSHTLWGAGSIEGIFNKGFFLNDLYMYAATDVIKYADGSFKVDVCPYEGGSDHTRFLQQNVPALLTWHFTDYTYHSAVDTLAMSSSREMKNVSNTTLATGLMMANATDDNEKIAEEVLVNTLNAAKTRFDKEKANTEHHVIYTEKNKKDEDEALAKEKEVLTAWADWYTDALKSVKTMLATPSQSYLNLESKCIEAVNDEVAAAIKYAETLFDDDYALKIKEGVKKTKVTIYSRLHKKGVRIYIKKSPGYKLDSYQVFRSVKRYSGFGTKPFFTTKSGGLKNTYLNTKGLKKGKTYFYKVRGVREVNGIKVYTEWSNKAYRTIK